MAHLRNIVARAELRAGIGRKIGHALDDRVADEMRAHAVLLEKSRLERQKRQKMIDELGELLGAPWPRGPDLRRDIFDDREVRREPLEAPRNAMREIR